MIHWRTDVENAPRDGKPFIIPSPWPPTNGESRIALNYFFAKSGAFQTPGFSHWSELNLPEEPREGAAQ